MAMAMAAGSSSTMAACCMSERAVSTRSILKGRVQLGAERRGNRYWSVTRKGRSGAAVAQVAVDIDRLVEEVKSLTLADARRFTDRLSEVLGVTAVAFPTGQASVAAPAEVPVVEEKTEFDLFLEEVPSSARIAVIKVVRTLTSLGLKEAKDLIEGLPKKVKDAVAKEEAEDALKQLEAAGAKCSIK